MDQSRLPQCRRQSDFTLIEAMVVAVILGIPAVLVVPQAMNRPSQAEVTAAKGDIKAIVAALDTYKLNNFAYPSTQQGLEALVKKSTGNLQPKNWNKGGCLKKPPVDPWGNPYQYLAPGTEGPFDLYSLDADGKEDGSNNDAEIGNWDNWPSMQASRSLTLIEPVVVMVIISVLIGLMVLSTGFASTSRELDNEVEWFTGLIGVLIDEVVLDNRGYGLRLERDAYQVLRCSEAKAHWLPVVRDSHRLPKWAELIFEPDGRPLMLVGSKDEGRQEKGIDQPQLLILSSGELSSSRLRLAERGPEGRALSLSSDGFRLPRAEVAR